MAIEDAGVAETINGTGPGTEEVPQSVLDNISETFSNADASELEGPGEETVSAPAQREVTRKAAVKQEQKDELTQEGLEDEDEETAGEEPAEEGAEEGDAAAAEDQAAVEPTPALDPNLRFVAQHFGWNDKQIDKLYKADPELATQTFEQFHNAFTAMSRQQGLLPGQGASQQPNPAAQRPQAPVSKIDNLVANLAEFSAQNGEPLGDFVKSLHDELVVPFRQMQAELQVQKQQAVAAEATTVTTDLAGKFPDVYGAGEKVNLIQQTTRQKLYEVADQLRAGAYQQGKEMSVKDAITRAHLIVTADRQQAAGRKQVQQQVQRRAKQITARPTQRVRPSAPGVARGEQTAAEAYRQRAVELGMDIGE